MFIFSFTVSADFSPSPLASEVLSHYPLLLYLANVTSNRAYLELVSSFESVFTSILLKHSSEFGNNLLLPLPIDFGRKDYLPDLAEQISKINSKDVSGLAASLLAIHLQAPESSLQVGRIDRLFAFIKANLTRGNMLELNINFILNFSFKMKTNRFATPQKLF